MSPPDDAEAILRYMEPRMEGGSYGPFEKRGYTYTLSIPLPDPSGDVARRALATMVGVSD